MVYPADHLGIPSLVVNTVKAIVSRAMHEVEPPPKYYDDPPVHDFSSPP